MQIAQIRPTEDQISPLISRVTDALSEHIICLQSTVDGIPTFWVDRAQIKEVLKFLRDDSKPRFEMLLDVTGID